MSTWRATATPAALAAAARQGLIRLDERERERVWSWLGLVAARLAAQRDTARHLAGAR